MAAQDYNDVVQQLYISYFGRPADYFGLQNFEKALDAIGAPKTFKAVEQALETDRAGTTALSKLVNSFNSSTESNELYGTDNSPVGIGKFVAAIYQNVLGREADLAGFNFWVNAITSGALTKANAAAAITQGALDNTSAQGKLDALTVQHKLAVANAFTTNLSDSPTEITAYAGKDAAAIARTLLAGVNDSTDVTSYQTDVNTSIENIVSISTPGQTISLTPNIDNLSGGAGNDSFIANITADSNPFGPLDVINGGNGRDSLSIADTSDGNVSLNGVTLKSIETLAVSATGTFGSFDISHTGVTNAILTSAGKTGAADITVADNTNLTLNVANADGAAVTGGKAVSVSSAGANVVTGAALTTVTVTGGTADISNDTATTAGAGTTLTSVTLDSVSGANTVAGKGVTTVNLANITDAGTTVDVMNATANHTLKLNVNGVDTGDAADIVVTDAAAKTVAISAASDSEFTLTAAKATTVTVAGNGAVALDLTGSAKLTSVDASAANGGVMLTNAAGTLATITTGAGDDVVTLTAVTAKDVSTTADTDETHNATVSTGAGDDMITVDASGDGIITVSAGVGNDTVMIANRGTAMLSVNLGAGDDTFTSDVAIGATDKIDAGAGNDMLSLALVGSANVGAFSNFDAFDAAGLGHALDVEILSQKNTVTEIVATGDVGANASLINVGAGVGYRITADTGVANALTITQKTAGDLTVTLDADESGDAVADTGANAAVITNATGVKAVFDTSFVDEADGDFDNIASLNITATAAKTIAVVSGGDNAMNHLMIGSAGNASAALASVTVSGAQALWLDLGAAAAKLTTIDASASTGGLVTSLGNVIDGGSIKLGSGVDLITVTSASKVGGVESIVGFEKTSATAVSTSADATSKGALIDDADMLSFTGTVAAKTTGNAGGDINAKGVLSFTGSGPTTLADAAHIADTGAALAGAATVFEYLGNTYVFVQGGTAGTADDTLVQLTGVIGVTNLAENGTTNHFFIV
jgi:hypothetical protein